MAVTQTQLTLSEQVSMLKAGGESDAKVDRKEEAQAILSFANNTIENLLKTRIGNADDVKTMLQAAKEAEMYMTSGASDVSEEDLKAFNKTKRTTLIGQILNNIDRFFQSLETMIKCEESSRDVQKTIKTMQREIASI